MNWTLINAIGIILIVVLSLVGSAVVAFIVLIVASMFYDKRRATRTIQEPITQVRVTVPRRQEIPDVFYAQTYDFNRVFEE